MIVRMTRRDTTRKKDGKVPRYWRLVRSVRVARRVIQPTVAQFGDVYLALALWRGTDLSRVCAELLPVAKERVAWEKIAAVWVTARLCEPSSELHIAEDWYRRTALDELLVHKDALEAPLAQRCGELFAMDNEVLL